MMRGVTAQMAGLRFISSGLPYAKMAWELKCPKVREHRSLPLSSSQFKECDSGDRLEINRWTQWMDIVKLDTEYEQELFTADEGSKDKGIKAKSIFTITFDSQQVRTTNERDRIVRHFSFISVVCWSSLLSQTEKLLSLSSFYPVECRLRHHNGKTETIKSNGSKLSRHSKRKRVETDDGMTPDWLTSSFFFLFLSFWSSRHKHHSCRHSCSLVLCLSVLVNLRVLLYWRRSNLLLIRF